MTVDTLAVREPTLEEQDVARGAAWLDEHFPGWEKRIQLDTLDLSHCAHCVLGQAYPDGCYCDVLRDYPMINEARLGFYRITDEYDELQAAWTVEIERRRTQSGR